MLMSGIQFTAGEHEFQLFHQQRKGLVQMVCICVAEAASDTGAVGKVMQAVIRGGWKMHAAPLDMSITPTVSLNGARVDGNRLQGRERSVELHDGDALWLKAGVEAEKVSGNMTLKAGIWRNITLNDMPGMTLRDDWKARHYDAEKADRYTVSFGINGKLTEKLSVQVKANSSFDGYFKTDAEGILGIRYDF